jgi:hypothetical protein
VSDTELVLLGVRLSVSEATEDTDGVTVVVTLVCALFVSEIVTLEVNDAELEMGNEPLNVTVPEASMVSENDTETVLVVDALALTAEDKVRVEVTRSLKVASVNDSLRVDVLHAEVEDVRETVSEEDWLADVPIVSDAEKCHVNVVDCDSV